MSELTPPALIAANKLLDETVEINFLPGLRILSRETTASLSDYPEWNPESKKQSIVTDGSCS